MTMVDEKDEGDEKMELNERALIESVKEDY